jgi:hypothetical protein
MTMIQMTFEELLGEKKEFAIDYSRVEMPVRRVDTAYIPETVYGSPTGTVVVPKVPKARSVTPYYERRGSYNSKRKVMDFDPKELVILKKRHGGKNCSRCGRPVHTEQNLCAACWRWARQEDEKDGIF